MSRYRHDQKGFTILELMISSLVFSIILLVCAAGILRIGQIYYKGIISSRTQEVTRSIAEDIASSLQFNGGQLSGPFTLSVPPITVYGFCIDSHRYSYILDKQLTDGAADTTHAKHVLVVDDTPAAGCLAPLDITQPLPAVGNPRELLGVNMRLGIGPMPAVSSGNLYTITLEIAYGEDDLLVKTGAAPNIAYSCSSILSGGQFCAVSQLTTTVEKRVQ